MKHLGEVYKGLTFSEAAKKIQAKYPRRDTDLIARKSYDAEIAELMKMNEMVKQANEATENVKQVMRNGGVIRKLSGGDFVEDDVKQGDYVTANFRLGLPSNPSSNIGTLKEELIQNNKRLSSVVQPLPLKSGVKSQSDTIMPTLTGPVEDYNPRRINFTNKDRKQIEANRLNTKSYDPFDPSLQAPKVNNPTATTANNYVTQTNTPTDNQIDLGDNATSVVNAQGQVEVKPGSQPSAEDTSKKGIFQKLYGKGSNIMNPALTGALANFGINAAILAGGYDKVAPNTNKYESDIRTMMQSRGIDTTAVQNRLLSQQNLANQNLANTRSANVRNALAQNINAGAMTAASQAELQSQQMRNQLTGEYANQLNSLGAQDAQARTMAEDLTARNKGAWQTGVSQLGASLADSGMFATKYLGNQQMERLKLEILNQSGSKFKLSDDIIGKLQRNESLTSAELLQMQASGDANIKAFADFYTKQNPAAGANQGGVTVNNTTLTTGNTVTPPATTTQTSGTGTNTPVTVTRADGTVVPVQTGGTNQQVVTTPTTTTVNRPGIKSGGKPDVYDMQQRLIAAGAKIDADGVMGPKTKAAMTQYPNAVNAPAAPTTPSATPAPKITTPTIVDDEPVTVIPTDIDAQFAAAQATQNAQNTPAVATTTPTTTTPAATVSRPGKSSKGDDATYDLQQKLIAAGAKITADGIMGPKTKAAMQQYPNVVNASTTTATPTSVISNPAQTSTQTVNQPATINTPPVTTQTNPTVVTPAPANNPINLGLPANVTTAPTVNQNQQSNTTPAQTNAAPAQTTTQTTPAPVSIKFNTPEEATTTYNTRIQNALTAAQSNNDKVIAKSEQEFKDMFASDKAVISIKTEKGTLVDEKDVNAFFNQALMTGSTGRGAKYSDITNVKLDSNGKIISAEIIELDRPMPNREANSGKRKGKRK